LYIKKEIKLNNNKILKIETGKIATRTTSSIIAEIDGTVLLIAVVHKECNDTDFFPLRVEYFERFYASGRIPCNYFKREGKPSEREIIIGRLVDRSIRPMFPKNFFYEVQITITVMSINPEINPDTIAINGASIALSLSGLPFTPIASTKITYNDDNIIINPSPNDVKLSNIELIISGTKNYISMIEGKFNETDKDKLINGIKECAVELDNIIQFIKSITTEAQVKNITYTDRFNTEFYQLIKKNYYDDLSQLHNKYVHNDDVINKFKSDIIKKYIKEHDISTFKKDIQLFLNVLERDILRKKIIKENKRIDCRHFTDIRKIDININFLKRVHGSSVFTRGETQAMVNITLGTYKDAQLIDCVFFSHYKTNFILHYNFPPYAVNEVGNINITKRREIGHGNLAKKALLPIIPPHDEYPYVIRIVSEITSSNGSSSMATVCGGSLALMGAGVPIKHHVAGIAMGLIKDQDNYLILSDISGEEDSIGDMDLKLAGTKNGITALQMDIKIEGLHIDIINKIIDQGMLGLEKILTTMESYIKTPQTSNLQNIPKIKTIKINKVKIKDIIGKNGSIIKGLTEKYKCEINVNNDGVVRLSSKSTSDIDNAISEIKNLVKEIQIGMKFEGKVIKLAPFGAFVNLFHKKDGLLHISKINKYKLENPNWEIEEGLTLNVIISKIDNEGKISLNLT